MKILFGKLGMKRVEVVDFDEIRMRALQKLVISAERFGPAPYLDLPSKPNRGFGASQEARVADSLVAAIGIAIPCTNDFNETHIFESCL